MQEFLTDYIDIFKNWNNFEGKTTRKSFWLAVLVSFIITILILAISQQIDFFYIVTYLYNLVVFVPFIALGVRRFHSVGRSGASWLWILLPIIGWIYIIIIFVKKEK